MNQDGGRHKSVKALEQPSARAQAIRRQLDPLLGRLSRKPETAGVCVLGSFALSGVRPGADVYSDFDIALFIDIPVDAALARMPQLEFQQAIQPSLPDWLPNFKFVYPGPDADNNSAAPPLQINIHQLVLPYEEQTPYHWPPDRREAFANTCDIVFDPSGRIANVIGKKSAPPEEDIIQRINRNLALIPVTIEHSVEKCALRDLLGDCLLAFAETIDYLLDLIYAINQQDIPHRKWRMRLLPGLPNQPENFSQRLTALLTTPTKDSAAAQDKIAALQELYEEVRILALSTPHVLDDPYRKLVSELRPGFQLRHRSYADEHTDTAAMDQYTKMQDSDWNSCNFRLPPEDK